MCFSAVDINFLVFLLVSVVVTGGLRRTPLMHEGAKPRIIPNYFEIVKSYW